MAEHIIQQKQNQMDGIDSLDAFTDDLSLASINRVKELLPQSGFDGLTELLGVLEAEQAQWLQSEQIDTADSEDRALMLDEVLALAEQHLNHTLSDETLDDLLFGVAEICTDVSLTEEDLAMLKELLLHDNTPQTATEVIKNNEPSAEPVEQTINHFKEQLNQLTELAESKELSGIQDILYAVTDWFAKPCSVDANDKVLTETNVKALQQLTSAVHSYLTLNKTDAAIQQLLDEIGQLDGEPVIQLEEMEDYRQLLIDEINTQASSVPPTPQITLDTNAEPATVVAAQTNQQADANIPQHLKEFIGLLQLSAQQLQVSLNEMLPVTNSDNSNLEQKQTVGDNFESELDKYTGVAGIAGFEGLKRSCEHLQANYVELQKNQFTLTEQNSQNWLDWIAAVVNYLYSPLDQDAIQQLLMTHCAPGWLLPLSEGKIAELLISLRELDSASEEPAEPLRQIAATDDDVSLQLPADIYPELLDGLLQELPVLTEQFSTAIQYLSKGGRKDDLALAQRVAHTIKGAGNTVGIKGIANLTHHLEDILTALANAETLPGKIIIKTLLTAADCLEEMSETLTSNGPAPSDAKQVLQDVLDLACRIDRDGVVLETEDTNATDTAQPDATEAAVTEQSDTVEETTEALIRVPISIIDKLMQFSNEVMIVNGQLRERLRQTSGKTRVMQNQLDLIYELGLELEELVDIRNYDLLKGATASKAASEFDSLEMDQYNELHTCSRRIHEVATDIREMGNGYRKELMDIDNMLIEQGHLNTSSHNDLLTMRQVPVQSVLARIQRSVRQACRLTGKNVDLQIHGSDLQMDRDILNGIIDPLMHVLRNAVDHGIESEEHRVATGKEAGGAIQLNFHKRGNQIEILCVDDGGGLNLEAIRAKGIERGIIEADADISEEQLKQLIFQPNFSTSANVTHVSGRGVGMDAVNSGVRSLGGNISLDSILGEGCELKISLPLSLVHYHSLLVKIGTQKLALAERSIEQILHPGAGTLQRENDQINFVFEDQVYPVKTLDALLRGVQPDNSITLEKRIVILVQNQQTHYAILVESIIGVTELVVKSLGDFMPNIHGVIGASILDDGSIAPVLDMQELLDNSSHWSQLDLDKIGIEQEQAQTCALVVDDSLSARRSLEQFVGDLGFRVMAARDGQEAIEMINNRIPDIVITDMEMPRVNGIELTEFIRANPDTSETHIPVIMITSRSTNKHRLLAQSKGVDVYLTKPYSEQELTTHVMEQLSETEPQQQAMAG